MSGFEAVSETETAVPVRRVREAVASGWHGVVWCGPVGSGAERCVEAALETLVNRDGRRVVRMTAGPRTEMPAPGGKDHESLVIVYVGGEQVAPEQRDETIGALETTYPDACVLTATDDRSWAFGGGHTLRPVFVGPWSEREAGRELSARSVPIAPNVAAELCRGLCGLRESIREVADALDDDELRGDRPLPDPLPLSGTVKRALRSWTDSLSERERHVALLASVAVDDRVEVLTEAAGVEVDELMDSPIVEKISLVGGRFHILDPRMRQIVHAEASLAERTRAHRDLAAVLTRRGDVETSVWHRSLGTLARDPQRAPDLLGLARRVMEVGDVRWAHAIAREAVSHAGPDHIDEARLLAGIAAVNAGWAREAREQLHDVATTGGARAAWAAMAPLALAMSRTGAGELPDQQLDSALATSSAADDPVRRAAAGRTLLMLTMLHAQRGEHDAARRDLERALLLGSTEWAAARTVRIWSEAWADPASGRADLWRSLSRAASQLPDTLFLDVPDGLTDACRAVSAGRLRGGTFRSPAVVACERVAAACALAAEGRHAEALESAEEAELESPAPLVFDGIIRRLRHRERICVYGRDDHTGPATALGASVDDVAARAVALAAVGNLRAANAAFALCDLKAEHSSAVPPMDIDIVALALVVGERETALTRAQRLGEIVPGSGHALAAGLRVASAQEYAYLADRARNLLGTFSRITERALVEAALADTAPARGDQPGEASGYAGIMELYSLSGASALRSVWEACRPTVPGGGWRDGLTPRERDVASRVVRGASNLDVAGELRLSVRTVEVHLGRVYRKLGVRSRTELGHLIHADVWERPSDG